MEKGVYQCILFENILILLFCLVILTIYIRKSYSHGIRILTYNGENRLHL